MSAAGLAATTAACLVLGIFQSTAPTVKNTWKNMSEPRRTSRVAKDFRMIQSSRRGYQPYGKGEWIAAIKKIHKHGGSVFAGDLQDKHPYLYNQGVWIFSDWDKALRAAGIDPELGWIPSLWDKEKIINELRRMQKQNLPLYAKYVMKNHSKLFHGALAAYASWNKALIAAGIITIPRKTRLGLLRELRDAVESRSEISQELRAEIAYYFGTLRHAKIALKTDAKLLSG